MDVESFLRPTGLDERKLTELGSQIQAGQRYNPLRVRKRHGGSRVVAVPDEELTAALKLLRVRLQNVIPYEAPATVFGYVPGRSIVGNASCHLGQPVVVCVDLVDFFGSIGLDRIERALLGQGVSPELVQLLLPITVVNGALPPGFSTSPLLSNIVFDETDAALLALAEACGARYSRYADDLTFSGDSLDDDFLDLVDLELQRLGWSVNSRKTRFMRRGGPQYVTGLYVGDAERPHVPRRVKRQLRTWFHYIRLYGYADCDRYVDLPSVGQLAGWLRHVNQVNPELVRKIIKSVDDFSLLEVIEQLSIDPSIPPHDDWDDLLAELGLPSGS